MKNKKTIEEAAGSCAIKENRSSLYELGMKYFIEGAKWQQERSYSEEEVLEIIRQYAFEEHLITSSKPDIWFEQFKNK